MRIAVCAVLLSISSWLPATRQNVTSLALPIRGSLVEGSPLAPRRKMIWSAFCEALSLQRIHPLREIFAWSAKTLLALKILGVRSPSPLLPLGVGGSAALLEVPVDHASPPQRAAAGCSPANSHEPDFHSLLDGLWGDVFKHLDESFKICWRQAHQELHNSGQSFGRQHRKAPFGCRKFYLQPGRPAWCATRTGGLAQ